MIGGSLRRQRVRFVRVVRLAVAASRRPGELPALRLGLAVGELTWCR